MSLSATHIVAVSAGSWFLEGICGEVVADQNEISVVKELDHKSVDLNSRSAHACHLAFCHCIHFPGVLTDENYQPEPPRRDQEFVGLDLLSLDEPELDGPRRPPRLS